MQGGYHMKLYIVMLLLLVIAISGCSTDQAETKAQKDVNEQEVEGDKIVEEDLTIEYQSITPADAKAALDVDESIILLDVRTLDEYNVSHIPKSILVPLDSLELEIDNYISDKTQKVFVYCRSGRRSEIAANQLIELGYTNVFDLGGINDWPYDTESN